MDVFTNAVINGGCDVVDAMLENGYKPSLFCLETACKHGHLDIVTRLLNYFTTNSDFREKGFLNRAFQTAVINQHAHLLDHLYLAGANVNYANTFDGVTLLHYAKSAETVTWLLDMGAQHVHCNQECTPLSQACNRGDYRLVDIFLSRGIKQTPDERGNTPLHHAVLKNYTKIVKLLLSYDRNPNVFNKRLMTPLHYACEIENIELVQLLLDHGAIHAPNIKGKYPIYYSCRLGNHRLVELLIQYNSSNSVGIPSPLSCACKYGSTECVRVLLEHGAVQDTRPGAYTYLHQACAFGYPDIVSLLLEYGGQQVPDENGNTPLLVTMKWNGIFKPKTLEIANILLSYGALQTPNNKGITPLHMACKADKNLDVLQLLLSCDFYQENLQFQDSKGNTPLHAVCENGDVEKLELLLEYGFEQLPNNNGDTPLHIACEELHNDQINILLDYEAIDDCANNQKRTPFDMAVRATIETFNTERFNLINFNDIRSIFGRERLLTLPVTRNVKTLSV